MNTAQSKAFWLGHYLNILFQNLASGGDPQSADNLKLKRHIDGFARSLGLQVEMPRSDNVEDGIADLRETIKLDIAVVGTEFVANCYLFGLDYSAWAVVRGGYKEAGSNNLVVDPALMVDTAKVEANLLNRASEVGLKAEFTDCLNAAKNPALSREQFNQYALEEVLLRMTARLDAAGPRKSASNRLFIVMPMIEEDPTLYDVLDAIKVAGQELNLNAIRIDEIESSGKITDNLVEELKKAAFVVVDLTHSRPNVYWEAGFTHGLGKTPIYVARKGTNLAFDIKDYPVIYFRNNRELKELLAKRLKAMVTEA